MIRSTLVQQAVDYGLLPEDMAEAFDEWSDELCARVKRGEITEDQADAETRARAKADALAARARGYPIGDAAARILAKRGQA